jgi:hypothetical protein
MSSGKSPWAVLPELNDQVGLEQALVVSEHRLLSAARPLLKASVPPPDAVSVSCVHWLYIICRELPSTATAAVTACCSAAACAVSSRQCALQCAQACTGRRVQ